MNVVDVASIIMFAASVLYVVAATRPRKPNVSMARHLFNSMAALMMAALVTASIALSGRLTTHLFVELTACMLVFGAVIHAFTWMRWLEK